MVQVRFIETGCHERSAFTRDSRNHGPPRRMLRGPSTRDRSETQKRNGNVRVLLIPGKNIASKSQSDCGRSNSIGRTNLAVSPAQESVCQSNYFICIYRPARGELCSPEFQFPRLDSVVSSSLSDSDYTAITRSLSINSYDSSST